MQSDRTNAHTAFRSTMWRILGSFFVVAVIGLCYGIVLQKKLEESKQALRQALDSASPVIHQTTKHQTPARTHDEISIKEIMSLQIEKNADTNNSQKTPNQVAIP